MKVVNIISRCFYSVGNQDVIQRATFCFVTKILLLEILALLLPKEPVENVIKTFFMQRQLIGNPELQILLNCISSQQIDQN